MQLPKICFLSRTPYCLCRSSRRRQPVVENNAIYTASGTFGKDFSRNPSKYSSNLQFLSKKAPKLPSKRQKSNEIQWKLTLNSTGFVWNILKTMIYHLIIVLKLVLTIKSLKIAKIPRNLSQKSRAPCNPPDWARRNAQVKRERIVDGWRQWSKTTISHFW